MKDYMSNAKLKCVNSGSYKKEGRNIVAVPEGELELTKMPHYFKEDHPVKYNCCIERYLKKYVIFLEIFSLLFVWISSVLSTYLIEKWHEDIYEHHHRPGMIP